MARIDYADTSKASERTREGVALRPGRVSGIMRRPSHPTPAAFPRSRTMRHPLVPALVAAAALSTNAAARHPNGVAGVIVIAAILGLSVGRASELAAPEHEGIAQKSAFL